MSDGFAEFVARRYPALVRSAYLLLGDLGTAEDLVQSALYRTYCHWTQLRAREAADAYTTTTMIRMAGRWRQRRWHGELPHDVLPEASADAVDVSASVDLRQALQQLPWEQRAVLVLRFLDDVSIERTAELLGCSVGTVKSRTSRGLATLRTIMPFEEARDG